jgi:hypothetical protein
MISSHLGPIYRSCRRVFSGTEQTRDKIVIDLRNGQIREYANSFREYTLPELRRMLREAGLEVQEICGDLKPCEGKLGLECDSIQCRPCQMNRRGKPKRRCQEGL